MVISPNKNRKIRRLVITPLLGVKIGRYRGKEGPAAHHYPATKLPLWGNIGPYRKGTVSIVVCAAMKQGVFFQDFAYILDTLILQDTL